MNPRYQSLVSRFGDNCWELLGSVVDLIDLAARPGAYVFGSARLPTARILEKKGWLEIAKEEGQWVGRLTDEGRMAMTGGVDPEGLWNKKWNGTWHMLMFDLPESCRKERKRLLRWLKKHRFGCLQGSLWITPHPVPKDAIDYDGLGVSSEQMLTVEAAVLGGYSAQQIAAKAWNYDLINAGYQEYMTKLSRCKKADRRAYRAEAIKIWTLTSSADPFLPKEIEPPSYLGRKAWNARHAFLTSTATKL